MASSKVVQKALFVLLGN
ncbi:rCG54711 [Rattus norvegicus]|uniref:RCG54711 n=1 Tax=Rattus norvegicus TaxID=10116 RepID=A6KFL2_RAT|nr:rCG54711 [Rattus norvegicus]